jgi:hypothetical protein
MRFYPTPLGWILAAALMIWMIDRAASLTLSSICTPQVSGLCPTEKPLHREIDEYNILDVTCFQDFFARPLEQRRSSGGNRDLERSSHVRKPHRGNKAGLKALLP